MITYSHDILFNYICSTGYYYSPNKPNKKKIKQLFECIPYFVEHKYQNILYKLIKKYPIESFYDTRETLMDYGYLIYKEFHIVLDKPYLSYSKYMDKFYLALYQDNRIYKKWIKHIIFIIIILIIIYYIYST